MAEKMEMNKQLEDPLLPEVPVEDNAVLLVSVWGLLNAGNIAITFAVVHILCVYTNAFDLVVSMLLLQQELTDAEVAKGNVLLLAYIWCSVPQAAGGTLALLLAGHRRRTRRALAYVVLAAAVAGHCMSASVFGIFLTSGTGYFFTIITSAAILIFAMGDLLGFLALLVGGHDK